MEKIMSVKFRKFIKGKIVLFINLLLSFCGIILAGSNGPTQPEFSNFESVTTKDMVNEFTGAFTYNIPVISIPGPGGSGYALSLSYHSGSSPEEEASWVGFGWTINPGSIVRQVKGFPDDYKNTEVIYYNQTRPNITASDIFRVRAEFYSTDEKKPNLGAGLSYCKTNFYNTFNGFNSNLSVGLDNRMFGSFGYNVDNRGNKRVSYNFNVSNILNLFGVHTNINPYFIKKINQYSNSQVLGTLAGNFYNFGSEAYYDRLPSNSSPYAGSITAFKPSFRLDIGSIGIGLESEIPAAQMISKQWTIPLVKEKVYGFMYSGDVTDDDVLMDYFCEKDNGITKRDRFLPVPFNNADNFILTGEGLQGGFKLHNTSVGFFRPPSKTSKTSISEGAINLSAGITTPPTIGIGGDYTGGSHTLNISKSNLTNSITNFNFASTQNFDKFPGYFFRFLNDKGGNITYDDNGSEHFKVIVPTVNSISNINNKLNINPQSGITDGRSSFIRFNLNKDIEKIPDEIPLQFNKRSDGSTTSKNFTNVNPDGIGEFSITNKDGNVYVYGLPVYTRNETSVSYGITKANSSNTTNNKIIYSAKKLKSDKDYDGTGEEPEEVVMGSQKREPYATTFLLTLITSPDYVDIKGDGPTEDDLGSYTKFNYRRVSGTDDKKSTDKWYKWRNPYSGLNYSRGSLSDIRDDIGSVSYGEKEIYYLESIETKTHIAYFITNKTYLELKRVPNKIKNMWESIPIWNGQLQTWYVEENLGHSGSIIQRKDNYEAVEDEAVATGDNRASTAYNGSNQKVNTMEFLEQIVLYSKCSYQPKLLEKKIQTVHFQYDENYPIWPEQPNSFKTLNGTDKGGKLTLKKVWFEYENIKDNKISPYIFNYEYKNGNYGYPSIYSDLDNYGNGKNQTPPYNPVDLDIWGNYQKDNPANSSNFKADSRHYNYLPWVNQKNPVDFDPAAWNLKEITLPSGGQIHIQYEQNDYCYVQNRPACSMFNIYKYSETDNNAGVNSIVLNLDQFNNNFDLNAYKEYLHKYFVIQKHKLYFKFLYALVGGQDKVTLQNQASEFIDGYVDVKSVDIWPTGTSMGIRINLEAIGEKMPTKQLCIDYMYAHRSGMFNSWDNINTDPLTGTGFDIKYEDEVEAKKRLDLKKSMDEDEFCRYIDESHSFIRLPLPEYVAKKGGGIRVKRILLFDQFDKTIENTEPSLYGSEYIYENSINTSDKLIKYSSGVATNEPLGAREENPLVDYLDFRSPLPGFAWGTDGLISCEWQSELREKYEGPYGETILPAPSVGYSKVISRSINSGRKNNGHPEINDNGYSVKEFYTVKDFPFDGENQTDETGLKIKAVTSSDVNYILSPPHPFPNPFYTTSSREYNSIQGYQFILNDMHGKIKSEALFAGNYFSIIDNPSTSITGLDKMKIENSNPCTSKKVYEYFGVGEKVPVLGKIDESINPILPNTIPELNLQHLGEEVEIAIDNRKIIDETVRYSGDLDITIPIPPIWPLPMCSFGYTQDKTTIGTSVCSKIISFPSFLKKITTTTDNITNTIENIAFDPLTGDPVLTKTYDGFNNLLLNNEPVHKGEYYNFKIMAPQQYPQLGQISSNENIKLNSFNGEYDNDAKKFTMSDFTFTRWVQDYDFEINDVSNNQYKYYIFVDYNVDNYNNHNCEILKYLSKGDLLKVTKSYNPNYDEYKSEFYLIGNIQCDVISLIPYYNVPVLPPQNDPTNPDIINNIKDIVNLEIIKSGKTNQLNIQIGDITTYGGFPCLAKSNYQSSAPNDDYNNIPEIKERKKFVDQLNSIVNYFASIWTPTATASFSILYHPPNTNYTPDLSLIANLDGDCGSSQSNQVKDVKINLEGFGTTPIMTNNGKKDQLDKPLLDCRFVKINISTQRLNYDATKPSPIADDTKNDLVNDLNNWLDKTWATNLIANFSEKDLNILCVSNASYYTTYFYPNSEFSFNINDITGLNNILNKSYTINGDVLKGSDFIQPLGILKDNFNLIYHNIHSTTDATAYVGSSAIKFITKDTKNPNLSFDNEFVDSNQDSKFWIGVMRKTKYDEKNTCLYKWAPCPPYTYFSDENIDGAFYEGMNGIVEQNQSIELFDLIKSAMNNSYTKMFGKFFIKKDPTDKCYYLCYGAVSNTPGKFWFPAQGSNPDKQEVKIFKIRGEDKIRECSMDFYANCNTNDIEYFILNENGQICINPSLTSPCPMPINDPTWNNELSCLHFCPDIKPIYTMSNVINAKASNLHDNWPIEENEYSKLSNTITGLTGENSQYTKNSYLIANQGIWRPQNSYIYQSSITPGANTGAISNVSGNPTNYNAGTFSLKMFNWSFLDANITNYDPLLADYSKQKLWNKTGEAVKYSPYGNLVETKDQIGVTNTIKYELTDNNHPSFVIKNAGNMNAGFEDFEYGKFNTSPTPEQVYSIGGHTGRYSLLLDYDQFKDILGFESKIKPSLDMKNLSSNDNNGILCQVWAKINYSTLDYSDQNIIDPRLSTKIEVYNINPSKTLVKTLNAPMLPIVKTGEWTLCQGIISDDFNQISGSLDDYIFEVSVKTTRLDGGVYIDDYRMLPLNAEMSCYVYDTKDNSKLLAVLDNEHLATYFQYNAEGKLIRNKKETVRGIKTVAEVNYNTPAIERDIAAGGMIAGNGNVPPLVMPGNTSLDQWKKQIKIPDEYKYSKYSKELRDLQNKQIKNQDSLSQIEIDMLKIKLNPNEQNVKIFGVDKSDIKSTIDSIENAIKGFEPQKLNTIPKTSLDSLNQDLLIPNIENKIKKGKLSINDQIDNLKENVINSDSLISKTKFNSRFNIDSISTGNVNLDSIKNNINMENIKKSAVKGQKYLPKNIEIKKKNGK